MGRSTALIISILAATAFPSCEDSTSGNPPEHAPVADAGPDQTVAAGGVVTLDGSGSSDPDGDPLTFAWRQVSGTSVELSSATVPTPTFLAPDFGDLVFELTVSDGQYESPADSVTVHVVAREGERPSPELIFTTPQGSVTSTEPRDVVLRGEEAFVADATDGLLVYDVPSLDAITLRGAAGPGLVRVRVGGDVAVGQVDSTSDGTVLFDISGDQPIELMYLGGDSTASMDGDDAYLYVTGRGIIWTVDAQTSPPMVVGAVDTGDFGLRGLALEGDRLYATGRDRMYIYDVSEPAAAALLGVYEPDTGDLYEVWANGTVAYAVVYPEELHAIDVSDPAGPVLLGSLPLTEPKDMAFSSQHAFVADDYSGVRVLDLAGASPTLLTTFDLAGEAQSLVLVGSTLAVAANSEAVLLDVSTPATPTLQATLSSIRPDEVELVGGSVVAFELDLVDLSDPSAPAVIGQIPYTTWTVDFHVVGSTYFGLKSPAALEVVDVSDPGAPEITTSVLLPMTYSSADLHGDTLYAVFSRNFDTASLDVVDVSSPRVPRVLGRAATAAAWDAVFVSDAGDVFARAELIDVSDPTTPFSVTTGRVGWPAEAHGLKVASIFTSGFVELVDFEVDPYDDHLVGIWGDVTDIAWAGSLLVATTHDSHNEPFDILAVTDLSDFQAPSLISHTLLPAQGYGVSVDGERVAAVLEDGQIWFGDPVMQPYDITAGRVDVSLEAGAGPLLALAGEQGLAVASGQALAVIDAADPSAPAVAATYPTEAIILNIHGAGDRLFLMVSAAQTHVVDRIDIIDVSDLSQPEKLGEVPVSEIQDLAVSGDVLYLASAVGLQCIDISAPDDPQEITTIGTVFPLFTLQTHGPRLYANGGIAFDISTPSEPIAFQRSMAGWTIPFALLGNLLVSAGSGDDLRVFDVTDPEDASQLGGVPLPGELGWPLMIGPEPIQMDGNWAWVARTDPASAPGGVRLVAVDLSLPAQPMQVASFLTEGRHMSFLVREGVLWTVSHSGLHRDTAHLFAIRTLRGSVTLREDHDSAPASTQLSYHVDFTDRDGQRDPQLSCAVTAGSCAIGAVDLDAHTAEVTWDLPSAPGDAEIAVVVGNERWSAVATDWLSVE